jgi:hypothetical protein
METDTWKAVFLIAELSNNFWNNISTKLVYFLMAAIAKKNNSTFRTWKSIFFEISG